MSKVHLSREETTTKPNLYEFEIIDEKVSGVSQIDGIGTIKNPYISNGELLPSTSETTAESKDPQIHHTVQMPLIQLPYEQSRDSDLSTNNGFNSGYKAPLSVTNRSNPHEQLSWLYLSNLLIAPALIVSVAINLYGFTRIRPKSSAHQHTRVKELVRETIV